MRRLFLKKKLFESKNLDANGFSMGDHNTRYFHLSTSARRRRNRILALKG